MTAKVTHHCNACGAVLSAEQAALYAGLHAGATGVAAGGIDWHSCGAACAARHLRDVADKVEAFDAALEARKKEASDNRAAFAKATEGAGPGTRS
jgi:hypothetical protein